jgi:hypothetical protein
MGENDLNQRKRWNGNVSNTRWSIGTEWRLGYTIITGMKPKRILGDTLGECCNG